MGLCAPHPHHGVPPWTRYTILLDLRNQRVSVWSWGTMWGYAPHTPHQGVPPWTRYTMGLGFKKSAFFCVKQRERCGAMRPTPPPGSSSLDPVHNFTGFKKSASFCVKQQERMCCSIPRQRLSVRSGPGQLVDRGFSDDRHRESLLSRMRFIPKTAPCRGEHGRNLRSLTLHAETLCITLPTIIAEWGCRGIIPLPAGGPRLASESL